MKVALHKNQLKVIAVLGAVALVMLCGVAYTLSRRLNSKVPASAIPAEHEYSRDARVSANERILWENNFGGSGDDEVVAAFTEFGYIYVFGNTTSSDLDFSANLEGGKRGFGARLSESGKTLEFTAFDFTVVKVIPTSSGFTVAGNDGSNAGIYLLTGSLVLEKSRTINSAHELNVRNLYVYDDRYYLISDSTDGILGLKTVVLDILSPSLELLRTKLFSRSYGLDFIDLMPYHGGYVLAAYAYHQTAGFLTLARFDTLTEPAYVDLSLGYPYRPLSVMPLGEGYAAIYDREGKCEMLTVSSDFKRTSVRFLSDEENAGRKSLLYAASPYAYTGSELIELHSDGSKLGSVAFKVEKITSYITSGNASIIAGIDGTHVKIAMISTQKSEVVTFELTSPASAELMLFGDGIILASGTRAATPDCAGHFGGLDAFICKIGL